MFAILRDPTVAWGRSGRAQRNRGEGTSTNFAGGKSISAAGFQDHDNADAKEALQKISARLDG